MRDICICQIVASDLTDNVQSTFGSIGTTEKNLMCKGTREGV